ncbi:MAG: hypothetical protein ACXVUL_15330 [Solirubrobacteraceae bacterium]
MSDYSRNRRQRRRQPAGVVSASTRRHTVCATGKNGAAVPEWATEHWKPQVEAEARRHLKHEVHGVRAAR